MSIRAYKLIEVKTKKNPTFNVSQNYKIEMAGEYDDDGMLFFEREVVQDEIKDTKSYTAEEIEILKNILKDMEGEDFVEYYCM